MLQQQVTRSDGESPEFGRRFLESPDQFPEHKGGTSCGEHELAIEFAGGPYVLSGLSATQTSAVEGLFEGYCRKPYEGEHSVKTKVVYLGEAAFRDPRFRNEAYYYDTEFSPSHVRLAGWNFMANISTLPKLSGVLWTRSPAELVEFGVFENYFRFLVAYRLLELGGILLHSAAILLREEAVVFFGRSGSGKTTVSRMMAAKGGRVLSDDLNALLPSRGRLMCQKVPFAGDFGRTQAGDDVTYPVRCVFRLKQGTLLAARSLTRAHALSSLMMCCPFVNHDPYRIVQLLSNLESITKLIEIHELAFTVDSELLGTVL